MDGYYLPSRRRSSCVAGNQCGIDYRSSDLIDQIFTTPSFSVPLDSYLSFQFSA